MSLKLVTFKSFGAVSYSPSIVTCSIVASRLDYFNAMLCSQNNLARVICHCQGRTDARPLLRSLHWLPVRQLVIYKVAHSIDSQGAGYSHFGVSHRPGSDPRTNSGSTLCCWLFPGHRPNSLGAFFLLQSHPSGTPYLLTLNCVKAFPHSNAT